MLVRCVLICGLILLCMSPGIQSDKKICAKHGCDYDGTAAEGSSSSKSSESKSKEKKGK